MGLLHGYAGLHVLRRGVIFVDLALAQVAALGAVVGLFFAAHGELGATPLDTGTSPQVQRAPRTAGSSGADELEDALAQRMRVRPTASAEERRAVAFLDFWPTVFALGGAVLLAFSRVRGNRVPHEAIIGIVYVVAAAVTVLLLSNLPHGREEMEQMLTGKLLFVDQREVLTTAALYAGLGLLHVVFYRPFLAVSTSPEAAEASGMHVHLWDVLFYAMFALMVTRSVAVGGVLVVFSFLIIPGACAGLLVESFRARIVLAWIVATVVSVTGMFISAAGDLPTGSTVVATFGAALVICVLFSGLVRRAPETTNAGVPPNA
jgi:zinc/manganese transport system permease protein